MQSLFGPPKKTPEEQSKEWVRQMRSEGHKLDQQIRKIQLAEKKVTLTAKQAAKKGRYRCRAHAVQRNYQLPESRQAAVYCKGSNELCLDAAPESNVSNEAHRCHAEERRGDETNEHAHARQ